MSMTRRRLSNNAREKEAGAELSNNGGVTSVKVGEIIRVALEQNELQNCSKLFANFHAHAMLEKSKNKMTLETLVTPMGVSENYNTSAINKLWEDDSVGISADTITPVKLDNINLEQTSSQVVDLLSEKLFSQGVQLNMNIPEGIMIQGRQEELEQAFYHLFAFAINSTQTHTFDKSITIQAHKLGDIVAFDLVHSGNGETTPELNIDLEVCQSLLEEDQAKIQLDKKIDQGGNVVGGRVKIIFKTGVAQTAAASQGRLVDLKVGSKKDIMASILNDLV